MYAVPGFLWCWPGLPGLWRQGRWRSLGVALAFAALLNGPIWATVWQPIGLTPVWLAAAWAQVVGFWVVSAWNSHRELMRLAELPKSQQLDGWYLEAQRDYLRGHWIEAEARLRRVLEHAAGDVEARLLLAAVYRRSGRRDEALEQLRELTFHPRGERWRAERELEARRLAVPEGENSAEPGRGGVAA